MRRSNSSAFSLIEVAVAIAIIAILAGAVAPLAIKALNQAREQKTREVVQTAYEAMVGSRSKSASNMRADFGFLPPPALADLRFMTVQNPAAVYRNGIPPLAYGAIYQGFTWGWNGPYWTGSTDVNSAPLDAWGRALYWATNQVQSSGVDGIRGTADDIKFPNPAAAPASATLSVTVERLLSPPPPPAAVTLQVTVYDRNLNTTRPQVANPPMTFPASGSQSIVTPVTVTPGLVSIALRSVPANAAYAQDQIISINPGENRTILFRLNN